MSTGSRTRSRQGILALAVAAAALGAGLWVGPAMQVAAIVRAPVVASVSPPSGPMFGSTQLQVTGSGFRCQNGATGLVVRVGGTSLATGTSAFAGGPPNVVVVSDSELLVRDPGTKTAGREPIAVTTSCGTSSASGAATFTALPECGLGCTVQVSAARRGSAAPRVGVLAGITGGWDSASTEQAEAYLMSLLHMSTWREGSYGPARGFYTSMAFPPQTEFILSDGFESATGNLPPWQDGYVTWDSYLTAMATGQMWISPTGHYAPPPQAAVAYWDIWNEPTAYSYFTPAPSTAAYDDLFAHTYLKLKALGASGKVLAPSVETLIDYPLPASGQVNSSNTLGMYDFLAWIRSYNQAHPTTPVHFDGYSFHMINAGGTCSTKPACPVEPFNSPAGIADGVRRMRNLLGQFPELLPAEIHVNEFDTPAVPNGGNPLFGYASGTNLIPGWQAGFVAALENSDAAGGNLACWTQPTLLGLSAYNQCMKGFDGLITDNNMNTGNPSVLRSSLGPQAIYWVYAFYAQMTGARLTTSGTASDVTSYATADDATSTVRILVGRHQRCSQNTSRDPSCPANGLPATVTVASAWPYPTARVHYSVQLIPDTNNGMGGILMSPVAASSGTVAVQNGQVSVAIPGVGDGTAYTITLQPG